jgi:hypothetical protein
MIFMAVSSGRGLRGFGDDNAEDGGGQAILAPLSVF